MRNLMRYLMVIIGMVVVIVGAVGLEHNQREIRKETNQRIHGECVTLRKALEVDRRIILFATQPADTTALTPERKAVVDQLNAQRAQARAAITKLIPESHCPPA